MNTNNVSKLIGLTRKIFVNGYMCEELSLSLSKTITKCVKNTDIDSIYNKNRSFIFVRPHQSIPDIETKKCTMYCLLGSGSSETKQEKIQKYTQLFKYAPELIKHVDTPNTKSRYETVKLFDNDGKSFNASVSIDTRDKNVVNIDLIMQSMYVNACFPYYTLGRMPDIHEDDPESLNWMFFNSQGDLLHRLLFLDDDKYGHLLKTPEMQRYEHYLLDLRSNGK